MEHPDFAAIERKWQAHWAEHGTFRAPGPGDPDFDASRPKYYVLDMFPYPSGDGLHVGHPKGYPATDVVARYKRHRGFNVLHPMGWDAFGLPAEQYAIQTGTHPAITTAKNVARFTEQLKALGFSYDWEREVNTTDPRYYRWTQWIFLLLHEQGLAYQAEIPVWWCEALGTVLANEEVIDGKSERGGHPCVRKPLRQWMLKITAFAERLLTDLELVDWPESVKAMQREWIGRSEGAEIEFAFGGGTHYFTVFTTRPDTLFGATFCVLAPEHPLVDVVTTAEQREAVRAYREAAARKSELDRAELQKEKTGVFTGAYAHNPAFTPGDPRSLVPVWIADYVLMSYGTGAIMCVPGGDQRDHEFATKFGLPITRVVAPADAAAAAALAPGACYPGEGVAVNSEMLDGMSTAEAKAYMITWLTARRSGNAKITYRLRDWLFSRQRYWGEPFPVLFGPEGEVELVDESALPVTLPELEDFQPAPGGEPPLARATQWVQVTEPDGRAWKRETNSMPQWAGSCWYYLRFLDPKNEQQAWSEEAERYWMPVDLYVGGAEHAVLHLLYARFWHKVLFDAGLVSTLEPFQKLVNQGMVQAHAYRDARGALVTADDVEERGVGEFARKSSGEPLERIIAKMSKSLKNVITPEEVISEYGADSMRLYEVFMGPVEMSAPWSPRDLPGVYRFLQRAARLLERGTNATADEEVECALHRTIRKVGEDVEVLALNTAVSAMMEFVNVATKQDASLTQPQADAFVLLLEPFAPHFAEEWWERLGHSESCAWEPWPTWDPAKVETDAVEIPVQVNGKVRARVTVSKTADVAAMEAAARAVAASHLEGMTVRKVVAVPGRMVNFVVS
ncbi:MAG: leucine--tRNA ligase [Planctomycetota bacterium]|nr:leucine--tRNA ligase [Planctomycetota bacterium]